MTPPPCTNRVKSNKRGTFEERKGKRERERERESEVIEKFNFVVG